MLLKPEYEDGVELWQETKNIFTISRKIQYIKLQRELNKLQYLDFNSIYEYRATLMRAKREKGNKFLISILQRLLTDEFRTITCI